MFLLVGTPVFAIKTYEEGRVWNGHVRFKHEHVTGPPRLLNIGDKCFVRLRLHREFAQNLPNLTTVRGDQPSDLTAN